MNMEEPVEVSRPEQATSLLGCGFTLCLLAVMVMGVIKLGLIWFG